MDAYFNCMNDLNKNTLLYHFLRSIHLHPPQTWRPRWQNVPYLEICKRATNAFVIHSNGSLLRCTSYPGVIFIFKFLKLKFEFSTGAIWFEFFACTGQIFVLTSLSCFMIYLSNMIQNVCEILFYSTKKHFERISKAEPKYDDVIRENSLF